MMANKFTFNDLIEDLTVFMEVLFDYRGVRYSITYDEDHAYLFNMASKEELAVVHPDEATKLVDIPLFEGKTLRDIWNDVEVELI